MPTLGASLLAGAPSLYDLGASAARIRKLWVTDIDFSGVITPSLDNLYVNVTGDTMTGDLLIQKATALVSLRNASDTGDRSRLTLTGFTTGPGDGSLDTQLNRSGVGVWQVTGSMNPEANNTRDLGTTAIRWRKLWSTDADFSGAVTVSTRPLVVSPAAGNALSWDSQGLFVASGAIPISPDAGNIIQFRANGLYVPMGLLFGRP